jgi:hypothetical protein
VIASHIISPDALAALVQLADINHHSETDMFGVPHGERCPNYCSACLALGALPSDVLDAARAENRARFEAEKEND